MISTSELIRLPVAHWRVPIDRKHSAEAPDCCFNQFVIGSRVGTGIRIGNNRHKTGNIFEEIAAVADEEALSAARL
jgi:hypothetical protein